MNGDAYRRLVVLALIALALLSGCTPADDGEPGNTDTDTDTATDTGTDTGTGTGIDTDTGTDTDTGGEVDGGVIEMDCTGCPSIGSGLDEMVCALDICDDSVVVDNSYTTPSTLLDCTIEDTYEAVDRFGDLTNDLDPHLNDSYALMGSGPVVGLVHNLDCDQSLGSLQDPYSTEGFTVHDVMEWKMVLTAPDNAQGFRFKYVFFSEEYDEFIGQVYNDKFYVILESGGTNSGMPTVINFSECRDPVNYWDFICGTGDLGCTPGSKYCFVAINTALSDCCWYQSCPDGFAWDVGTNIDGTGFACSGTDADGTSFGSSTGWLQTAWPIQGSETFTITFHIHDTSDGILDSAAIIDAFEFMAVPTEPVTEPVE